MHYHAVLNYALYSLRLLELDTPHSTQASKAHHILSKRFGLSYAQAVVASNY